jgi:CRP/FNR family cyclic AMP-dependent transcriptional regulator
MLHPETEAEWPAGTLLAALSPSARAELLRAGSPREFSAGERLIFEGADTRDAFLIVFGVVKVTADTLDGQTVLLDVRFRGDLVGEVAGLDGGPRTASVTAAGLVRARAIGTRELERLVTDSPEISRAVTTAIAEKLRWSTRRRISQAQNPLALRLVSTLLDLAKIHGRGPNGPPHDREGGSATTELVIALTQPELAALVGASEPSVHRVLTRLRKRGILRTQYRSIVILDRDALSDFLTQCDE